MNSRRPLIFAGTLALLGYGGCRAEGPFRLAPEEVERGGWYVPAAVTRWMTERPQEFASALRVIWRRLNHDGR